MLLKSNSVSQGLGPRFRTLSGEMHLQVCSAGDGGPTDAIRNFFSMASGGASGALAPTVQAPIRAGGLKISQNWPLRSCVGRFSRATGRNLAF